MMETWLPEGFCDPTIVHETNSLVYDAKLEATKAPSTTQLYSLFLPSALPSGETVTFKNSSFFRRNGPTSMLPSPSDILAEAYRRGVVKKINPPPVHYPSLGLTVKYGYRVSSSEGQCLWAFKRLPGNVVPVPEVYGWTTQAGFTFIYMELISGETLSDRWDSLSGSDKRDICGQLRAIVTHIRNIPQPYGDKFIGTICRQPLLDLTFTSSGSPPVGPFTNVTAFHDLLTRLPHPENHDPSDPPHPFRKNLPDDVPIVFTHGDLHRSNVIISSRSEGGSPRVLSLIDWGQSGWYPSYWEFCKAR
ncbi:unnamed protein product [Rhizoctonia solani]|uniref:Aminoglycoside phosphotransferase domain-containing protein n=1 Tax=Rhizoctonia solani TaxID=456999 RepID=A0A8H2XJJ0_9AGAM|nr:unnamed protein product [Rhizoctonia solani]